MKIGIRTPSPTRSLRARTTGRIKRAAKSTYNPVYGIKGIGYLKNPERAIKNKIYHKVTVDPLSEMKEDVSHTFHHESKGIIIPIVLFYLLGMFCEGFAVFSYLSQKKVNIISIIASIIGYVLFVVFYKVKYE